MEAITAINHGGLRICYNIGKENVQLQSDEIRPVLSLEISYPSVQLTSRRNNDGRPGKMMSN